MLTVANTTLDLLVLELVLHGLGGGVGGLLLLGLSPVDAWSEDDVLADGGGIGSRSWGILCTEAELGPGFSVGDAGVYGLGVGCESDAASGLNLATVVIVAECDDGLCSILVGNGLRLREIGGGLLDVVVVGPVVPFSNGGVSQRISIEYPSRSNKQKGWADSLGLVRNCGSHDEASVSVRLFQIFFVGFAVRSGCVVVARRGVTS